MTAAAQRRAASGQAQSQACSAGGVEQPIEEQMAVAEDPVVSAQEAGLRYVNDTQPGYRRLRTRYGFRYVDSHGRPLREPKELARFAALTIPPAWTDVWVCPNPRGHLQATGRDARGRKQYRYHPRWRAVRDENKFWRMAAFGKALPRIRARTAADLGHHGLTRERLLATIVQLLDATLIRVGNE